MRRFIFLLLAVCLCAVFAACGKMEPAPQEPITLFVSHPETEPEETTAARICANDTYGETHTLSDPDARGVLDTSYLFRTKDSYRFEPTAVEHARELYRQTVRIPDSLRIKDMSVWDCADDGDAVYYSIYLNGEYAIQSGELIERGAFYDLGVRKDTGEIFEVADLPVILEKYSLLQPQDAELSDTASAEDEALSAMAKKLLKDPQETRILSLTEVQDRAHVYTILCEGVNSYGIPIRETRDVELFPQETGWSMRTAAETF